MPGGASSDPSGADPVEAACTIASRNYLAQVRIFARSFREHNPRRQVFLLLVDDSPAPLDFRGEPFEVILAKELGVPDFPLVAFKYNIIELNTALKPSFIKFLQRERHVAKLLYFDPDIRIFAPLDPLFEELDRHVAILTPHVLSPGTGAAVLPDSAFLKFGVFNLGFIGVQSSKDALDLLNWWEAGCLSAGHFEPWEGIFVDQKWMNLLPCFSEAVKIIRSPGCNMAYWNLHERTLSRGTPGWKVNSSWPLLFFHFSNLDMEDPESIVKSRKRPTLSDREDLRRIFSDYREQLRSGGYDECRVIPYHYGYYSNGIPVGDLARRVVGSSPEMFRGTDPFDALGESYRWIMAHSLNGKTARRRPDSESAAVKAKLSILDAFLRSAFRLLGANNYQNLLYYMRESSSFSRQAKILKLGGKRSGDD